MFHGGLVGKDDACIHADNSMTACRNRQHRPWCQKHWHHNCATASASHAPTSTLNRKLESLQLSVWPHVSFAVAGVHDCRGKCMRGDDFTQNLSMHHNVIFNCGEGPVGTDGDGQSFGVVLKGAFGPAIDLQRSWRTDGSTARDPFQAITTSSTRTPCSRRTRRTSCCRQVPRAPTARLSS